MGGGMEGRGSGVVVVVAARLKKVLFVEVSF